MTDREIFKKETGLEMPYVSKFITLSAFQEAWCDYWKSYALWLEKRSEADKEKVLSAIQDGLYATKNLTTVQCEIISEGIYQYLCEHGFTINSTPPDEANRGRG